MLLYCLKEEEKKLWISTLAVAIEYFQPFIPSSCHDLGNEVQIWSSQDYLVLVSPSSLKLIMASQFSFQLFLLFIFLPITYREPDMKHKNKFNRK